MGNLQLRDMVERICRGDETAARDFVRLFEPQLRLAIRVRLARSQLRRLFDSMDVSQSVFRRFFHDVANDPAKTDDPVRVRRSLLCMARNKLASHARKLMSLKRDLRRDRPLEQVEGELAEVGGDQDPGSVLADCDALALVRTRLTADEYDLLSLHSAGLSWLEIGVKFRATADAVRKKAERAADRVRVEMKRHASSHV